MRAFLFPLLALGLAAQEPPTPAVLDFPMSRDASGTAWQPDDTPHTMLHDMAGDWMLMGHGTFFAGDDVQQGPQGGHALIGIGWAMGMARRDWAEDRLEFRAMLSPEPFLVPGRGYPLLLQSGETYRGEALHDTQHPHDLFMELSATWTHAFSDGFGAQLYAAPSGEPALGPIAFPHRASAADDPLAALGHHWIDSTHISFGVLTAALFTPTLKLEVSRFNGREPDEVRTNFDFGSLDSSSARLTWNPDAHWSAQLSAGRLASPEALEPGVPETRATFSVSYAADLGSGSLAATAGAGRVRHGLGEASSAAFLEATWNLDRRNSVFGRAEWVEKSGADLALDPAQDAQLFPVKALSLGYLRNLTELGPFHVGIGGLLTVNEVGADLAARYGQRHPLGGMVYLRIGG